MKSALILLAMALVGLAAAWLPKKDMLDLIDPLVLILAILAGLLAQMIALTAVIFEPGRTSSKGIREIGDQVDGLQRLNIGLFALYLLAVGVLIAQKLLLADAHSAAADAAAYGISVGAVVRGIAGALVCLCVVRTFRTLEAIRSLQSVRSRVQVEEAQAREQAAANRAASDAVFVEDQGGAKYGTIRELPKPPRGRAAK